MGLFDGGIYGIKGAILGTNSNYHIDPMQLAQADYLSQIKQSQQDYNQLNAPGIQSALGALGRNDAAGGTQADLIQQILAQANGQGPSLAQLQLQQASDQNIKNAASAIAGVKGINPAQAARQAALAQMGQGQNLANQSAQLRLNEQLQKQAMAGNLLQQQRAQDLNQYQNQLGSNQQMYSTAGQLNNQQNQNALNNYYGAAGINSGISQFNAGQNQKDLDSDKKFMSGMMAGMAAHGAVVHEGKLIPAYSDGGQVSFVPQQIAPLTNSGDMIRRPLVMFNEPQDQSSLGTPQKKEKSQQTKALEGFNPSGSSSEFGGGAMDSMPVSANMFAAKGAMAKDNVKVAVSPGEKIVSPEGSVQKVPGVSNHPGDDIRNDKVIADLREGSIVVPRSKANDKEKMVEFIKHMKTVDVPRDAMEQLLESHNHINAKLEEIRKKMATWRKA